MAHSSAGRTGCRPLGGSLRTGKLAEVVMSSRYRPNDPGAHRALTGTHVNSEGQTQQGGAPKGPASLGDLVIGQFAYVTRAVTG
jgi:hypothetical protein